MKRLFVIVGLVLVTSLPLAAAPDVYGKEVQYVGGSLGPPAAGTIGTLDLARGEVLVFESKQGRFEIPYEQITAVEYGQKLKRKLPLVTRVIVPLALRPRKKRHYVAVRFHDDGADHVVLFEVPKGMAASVTTVLEVRTGKKIRPLSH